MGDNDDFDNDYDDEDEEQDDDLENQYYYSEALNEENPDAALTSFENVLTAEKKLGVKGDWGFKSLEQIVKIHFRKKNFDKMLTYYKEL